MTKVPIEVSARHLHLNKETLEKLFGEGYELNVKEELSQPDEFAAEEAVKVKTKKNELEKVRIVGELRDYPQFELSKSDAFFLGIDPPLRVSGDIENTPSVTLVGPKGKVDLKKGVIIAKRHIHCNPEEAKELGLEDKKEVSVKIMGKRPLTFHDVVVRVDKSYKLSCHLDTDEGNAAGVYKKCEGIIKLNLK
ncbi:MAG: phosphate propanoyltransferase [Minisyncoccales bacterium]